MANDENEQAETEDELKNYLNLSATESLLFSKTDFFGFFFLVRVVFVGFSFSAVWFVCVLGLLVVVAAGSKMHAQPFIEHG